VKYTVRVNGVEHEVEVCEHPAGGAHAPRVLVDGEELGLVYRDVDRLGQVLVTSAGRSHALSIEGDAGKVGVTVAGHAYDVEIEDERERAARAAERASSRGGGVLKSSMPGVVVQLLVTPGEAVREGQPLLILEAMKMQNELVATADGVVGEILVAKGQAVAAGARLLTIVVDEG
jgi:biotin carboxyl carrier protein